MPVSSRADGFTLLEVTIATSSRRALDIVRNDAGFDVILCEMVMPHITGMEFHAKVCQLRPEMAEKIIFMTSSSLSGRIGEFLRSVPNARLDKPFDIAHLLEVIRARAG